MNADDNILIQSLRSSKVLDQNKAFQSIYEKFFGMILTHISNNNGNLDDAKDVFQDGIIVLYNKVRSDDFYLNSTLKTFFFAICKNVWYNKLRKSKRIQSTDKFSDEEMVEDSILETIMNDEKYQQVGTLLNQLGDPCRKLLISIYFKKYKMVDVAKEMGYASEGVAKNKKAFCLKKLRTLVVS